MGAVDQLQRSVHALGNTVHSGDGCLLISEIGLKDQHSL